jgi:hypothetical protein
MSSTVLERSSTSHEESLLVAEVAQQALPQHNIKAAENIRGAFRTAAGFAGHILAILAGLAVYRYTGLYDAMDTTAGQIVLGSAIVYWHVIIFRLGLYSK